MTTKHHETIERVEFRWRQHEEQYAELLIESARKAGRSVTDHARELMKTALTSSEQLQHHIYTLEQEVAQVQNQLRSQLRQLTNIEKGIHTVHDNVYQVRDDLATCVVKILSDAGRMQDAAAQRWAKDTLDTD